MEKPHQKGIPVMQWQNILRRFYHALPESYIKNILVGMAYRLLYPSIIKSYSYDKKRNCWKITTTDNVTLFSLRDFDPAPLCEHILSTISPGSYVLDLGGNIGMVAIYLAKKVGPQGHVWAYEPDRKNQKLFQSHLELNNVSNVTLIPAGVWNESGTLTFYEGGTYTSSFVQTNYIHDNPSHYEVTSVPVVTLDEQYQKHQWKRIDFIKMDIEGSEIKALQGAKKLLLELSPTLFIETHLNEGKNTTPEVQAILTSLGYTVESKKNSEYPTLIAYKYPQRRVS